MYLGGGVRIQGNRSLCLCTWEGGGENTGKQESLFVYLGGGGENTG